jgi:hypothetical protein
VAGSYAHGMEILNSIKMCGISSLAEKLSASEIVSSTESVHVIYVVSV